MDILDDMGVSKLSAKVNCQHCAKKTKHNSIIKIPDITCTLLFLLM